MNEWILLLIVPLSNAAIQAQNKTVEPPCRNVAYNVENLHQEKCNSESCLMINLVNTVTNLEKKLQKQEDEIRNLEKKHKDDIDEIKSNLAKKQSISPLIAFHVARTSSQSSKGKIAFNKIISNHGNGWDSIVSTFRAPVKGLYFFSLTIAKDPSGRAWAYLARGSSNIAVASTSTSGSHGQSTTSTVLSLNAGEHVYGNHVTGTAFSNSALYTHLVGFLVRQTN